jgi:hypothetical protein
MRTPLRQRIAAIAQAVAPMDKKIVPRTIFTTWARSISNPASGVIMTFIVEDPDPLRFVLSGDEGTDGERMRLRPCHPTTRSCSLMQFLGAESQLTPTDGMRRPVSGGMR